MHRAVLDTNVLIASLVSERGVPAQLNHVWQDGNFTLITSDYILEELERIALLKLNVTKIEFFPVLESIYQLAEIVAPISVACDGVDAQDLPILGTAVAGAANWLVSGDKRLLQVERYKGIAIVTPRTFLELLNAKGYEI